MTASSLLPAELRRQHAWQNAPDICNTIGIEPSLAVGAYPARRFMFELLSDANTTGRPGERLNRWLINGNRFNLILEVGAWHSITTCGLFHQKNFRLVETFLFFLEILL